MSGRPLANPCAPDSADGRSRRLLPKALELVIAIRRGVVSFVIQGLRRTYLHFSSPLAPPL